jgi:glycosyl transferase family 87
MSARPGVAASRVGSIETWARPPQKKGALPLLLSTGAGGVALSWVVAQHSLIGARWQFVGLMAAWVPLWIAGSWAAGRVNAKMSLAVVLLLSVALRLAAATGTTPSISTDLYRYSWDAHVQLSGIDPYRYPPDAAQLAALRTDNYWPTPSTCRHLGMASGCTVLNRPQDRTIYPPVAEAWFDAVHVVTFGASGSRPWQLAAGLVDDLTIVLIAVGLRRQRRDPRQVAWYALSPLPVVELAGNGHVDGLALLLLVAAVLALRRDRRGWAGILIGLATMVKLYPAVALAAWWRRGRSRMVIAAAGVCLMSYAPHVIAVGTRVVGYLPGYLNEEHYTSGGRFLLLGILGLPGSVATALAVLVLAAVTAHVVRTGYEPAFGLALVLAALILVTTPVQPWYAVTVAGLGALAGIPWLVIVGLAAEPYYAAVILNDPHQVAAGRISYGIALALMVGFGFWSLRRARPSCKGTIECPVSAVV